MLERREQGATWKDLREGKDDASEATLVHEAVVLKQWLRWAVERGHLQENPFRAIAVKKPPRRSRHVPSLDELWQLLEAASSGMRPLLMTLAFTGMRSGELRRLRVEDVDRKSGWIHIVSRQGQETKT